jgi:hypothetical protein
MYKIRCREEKRTEGSMIREGVVDLKRGYSMV